MNIGVIVADSNGDYPVPASKGGAVSTLVENLIRENSKKGLVQFTIFSYFDEKAYLISKKYSHVKFVWVKIPKFIHFLDKLCFLFMQHVKNAKAISFKTIFSLLYYIIFVSSRLKEIKFDKLVLENNIPLIWIIRLSQYKGEFIYHFHNVPRINAHCKEIFKSCNGYLCVSRYVAKQIESPKNPIGPIDKGKVKILYNAINTSLFKKISFDDKKIRKKCHININDKVIIYVGRLSKEKGIDILLDSIKCIKFNQFKLLIVGSVMHGENDHDSFTKSIINKAKKINKKVVFTGYVSQSILPILYNLADVAVLPSIWDEPAGLTMIEALSCGVPVITTKSGGIPEYVGSDAIVLKRDKNLVANIAKSVDKILKNESIYRGKGRKRINKYFNEDDYIDRFVKCLREINHVKSK